MEIETQVVNRTLKQNLTPDDGDSCPDEPDDLQEFDVWGQKYPLELDFQEHERSIQIPETRERITCDRCEGSGKTSCADCDGSALVTCGKGLFSIGCGGSGQVDITRERKVLREGGRVGMDGSEYRTVREVIGTKNCSHCHGHGQVKCKNCNSGLVQCDSCEGKRLLIKYTSVEQREFPIKDQTTCISPNLPSFRSSKKNPTSNLSGDLCLSRDQCEVVSQLDITQVEENSLLVKALSEHLKSDQKLQEALLSGRVFRQLVKIYIYPVSEFFYSFNDKEYSIFVNRNTKVVEDVSGPIAQEADNLTDQSKALAKEKKYLKSFAANQKAKTLVSSNPWEIKIRKALVDFTEFVSLGLEKSKKFFSKFFRKSPTSEKG